MGSKCPPEPSGAPSSRVPHSLVIQEDVSPVTKQTAQIQRLMLEVLYFQL